MLKKDLVCVFPFLGKKSIEMKKRPKNSIEITLPYRKLKTIFKSSAKTVNHFHFKDVFLFIMAKQSAIFTSEQLNIWEFPHLTNKRLKNVQQSAISDHLLTCHCNINFNDFTILSKDSNNFNLLNKWSLLKLEINFFLLKLLILLLYNALIIFIIKMYVTFSV